MGSSTANFPALKSIERISKIPVVEKSVDCATNVYFRIKNLNPLVKWGLNNMEGGVILAINASVVPVVPLIQAPLIYVDGLVNKSLDNIEQRVPAINYPPEQILHMTKEMVSNSLVQPVLKRADSVKTFSVHEATKYSDLAATRLDSALTVADKYVEKYLPDSTDTVDTPDGNETEESKTVQTIHHANRLSKKLQRRLTKRTIAEARALQKQSKDAAEVALFMLELLVKDPKQFTEKVKAIWAHYSLDEPENQVPPENLEQLLGMLAREMARRFVHVSNFIWSTAHKLPSITVQTAQTVNHHVVLAVDYIIKTAHLDGAKAVAIDRTGKEVTKLQHRADHLYILLLKFLESIDVMLKRQLSQMSSSSFSSHEEIPLNSISENSVSENEKNKQNAKETPPEVTKSSETVSEDNADSKCPSINGSACSGSGEN